MKKFNKCTIALAVAGALALPQMAMAADMAFSTSQQITFAKDLIVDNGTTIYAPAGLELRAQATDAARMATIAAGHTLQVKITLSNGAKFDASAPAPGLVAQFRQGTETGGAPGPLTVVGTPYYSASGSELNFQYTATAVGQDLANPAYTLQINGLQITNLVEALKIGNQLQAEITVQNVSTGGQQILAASQTIARSVWGEYAKVVANPDSAKRIDVAGCSTPSFGRLTRFSPSGAVGNACVAGAPANSVFNAGTVEVGITRALETDGATLSFVNNFNATAANPEYNLVGTGKITTTVVGSDFSNFTAGRTWLDLSPTCAHAAGTFIDGVVGPNNTAVYNANVTHPLYIALTQNPPASPVTVNVCFSASAQNELVPQALSGKLEFFHQLPTQRVDPPAQSLSGLTAMELNGAQLVFQNVNPAGNPTAQSFMRITNNNAAICPVTIDAKDDAGRYSGKVRTTLPAHQSYQFNVDALESGSDARIASGSLGNGTGKWYLRITAECSNFKASALNRNAQSGTVTDLTPEKGAGIEWLTPTTLINP